MYQSTAPPSLEQLVCNRQTKQAIEQLKSLLDNLDEPRNELICLLNRLNDMRHEEIQDTEEHVEIRLEVNKTNVAFLKILADVREEIQSKIDFFQPTSHADDQGERLRQYLKATFLKKYSSFDVLSEGKTFMLFRATEQNSNMDVLVKVLKTHDIDEFREKSQIGRINQLKHRNLIQLLDVNFQTYPFHIVTEFVDGIPLSTLMAEMGPVPLHNVKRLILTIANVLNLMRQKRFRHAGIRPSKILIDQELEPEISPFDLLHTSSDKLLFSTFFEASHYFAPEILYELGVKTNAAMLDMKKESEKMEKANQFCLAALAYEMLTGNKLFDGDIIADVLFARLKFFKDAEFRKTKLTHPNIPSRLSAILRKMLAQNPAKRYEDLHSAMQALSSVEATLTQSEEKAFASYRRALSHTDDFVDLFYKRLSNDAETANCLRDLTLKEFATVKNKFYLALHLIFDVENAVNFLKTLAKASDSRDERADTPTEYMAYFDALSAVVLENDPRHAQKEVKNAWADIRKRIVKLLPKTLPTTKTAPPQTVESRVETTAIEPTTTISSEQDVNLVNTDLEDSTTANTEAKAEMPSELEKA